MGFVQMVKIKSNLPDTPRSNYLVLETDEQRESYLDPIRGEILRILIAGQMDVDIGVEERDKKPKSGKTIIHSSEIKKPITRYWMTPLEILEKLKTGETGIDISRYTCYYHLHKLHEQGFIEQHPPPLEKGKTRKKTVRGMFFRAIAKNYVPFETEQLLRESEERYRSVFDNTLTGMARISLKDGKVLFCNDAAARILGFDTVDEVIEDYITIEHFVDPDFRERAVQRALGTDGKLEYQTEMTKRNGETFWIQASTTINEEEAYADTIFLDVTERKQAEEEIRKSEEKYRNLIEQMHDGYLVLQDGKVAFANQIMANMFGYTMTEFEGLPFTDLVASEDLEMVSDRYQRRLAGEVLREKYDTRLVRKDGTRFIGLIGGSPLEFNGKPATLTTLIDVTEKRRLEQETQYLASLVENVSDAIVSTDEKFIIRSWNKAAEEIYGWKAEQVIGKPLAEILQSETIGTATDDSKNELIKTGRWDGEAIQKTKDGHRICVQSSVTLLRDNNQTPIGAVAINADITQQKETEEALRESELRNRTIVDSMSDLVFVYDSKGRHSEYYGRNESLLVRPWRVIKGKTPEEVVPQDIATLHNMNVNQIRETGESITYDYELEINSILRWFRATMMLHEDRESIVVAIKDINETKTAEISLKQSEEKYRSLWDNSINGLAYHELMIDDDGKPFDSIFLEVNSSFERISGLKRVNVVGKRLSEVKLRIFKENLDPSKTFWRVALSGEPMSFEVHIPETEKWFSMSVYSPSHGTFVSVLQDITERKIVEDSHRQSVAQLKQAQHLAKMGFLTWNLKTNEMLWSDEVFSMYGVDKNKVQPTMDYTISLVHPNDLAFVQENLDAAVKGKQVYDIDHRIVQPNGKIIWVHAQGEILYDSTATPMILLGTVIDITERKSAEKEIIANKEKFRSVFEDSAMANNLLDSSGTMVELNQACVDMFGLRSKEDLLGFNLFEDSKFPDDVKKRVLSGETVRFVSEFDFNKAKKHTLYNTTKSGIIYLDTLVAPFGKTEQGSVAGYFVQMLDITERVRITELQRASEEKYRGIFNHTAFGIVLASKDDKVIDANPEMEALLGYTHEELCNMKIADFSHPEDDAIDKEFAQQLMKGEMGTFRMEKRYIKKSGDTILANLTVSTIPDINGHVDFLIEIIEQISPSSGLKRHEGVDEKPC
jgi:PAS domain S-box-containing protein